MKSIQTKRYTINNRRSDCLIKEKLIAEAAEEAAAEETYSQRQHKRFDFDQYLRRFYKLTDYRKEFEQFALQARQSVIPDITRDLRRLTNLPDYRKEFEQLRQSVISISAIESQALKSFYDKVSHARKEMEQAAQKICNNYFAAIDEVNRIPKSGIDNMLKSQQENYRRICDEVILRRP